MSCAAGRGTRRAAERCPGRLPAALASCALLSLVCAGCGGSGSAPSGAAEAPGARAEEAAAGEERRFWELFRSATRANRAGDRAGAIAAFERALALRPRHPDSLHYLAQLRYARGEVGAAVELLERLTAAEPRGVRAWQQLGVVHGTPVPGWAPDLRAALAAAEEALARNPGNSGTHLLRARWAAYLGDREVAQQAVETSLGLNPYGSGAYALAAWLALRAGDVPRAAATLARARSVLCAGGPGAAAGCLRHAAVHLLEAALRARAAPDARPRGLLPAALVAPAVPSREPPVPGRSIRQEALDPQEVVGWEAPVSARADLDGDGAVDLLAKGPAPGAPAVLLARQGAGWVLLPHGGGAASGWGDGPRQAGPRPVPWRGVLLRDLLGETLVLVGGGRRGVRLYRPAGAVWEEVPASGLPAALPGGVVAAADWNGDGLTDLFLANVPAAPGPEAPAPGTPPADQLGRLYLRAGPAAFRPTEATVSGPLGAALALDVDGDGAGELVVAGVPDPPVAAAGHLLRSAAQLRESRPVASLSLWRYEDGGFRRDPGALPFAACTVQDLGAVDVDGDGDLDLYVATGPLAPEGPEPDRLWLNRGGRYVDASPRLGAGRFAGTLRVWGLGPAGALLLRGGLVPGDPPRVLRLRPGL